MPIMWACSQDNASGILLDIKAVCVREASAYTGRIDSFLIKFLEFSLERCGKLLVLVYVYVPFLRTFKRLLQYRYNTIVRQVARPST